MTETSGGKEDGGRFAKERFLARVVKSTHWPTLKRNDNIVGMAFGRRMVSLERTDAPAVVVYVARKVSRRFLPPSLLLPRRIYVGGDWIEVDVHETGPIYFLSFTAKERPAPTGVSIGHLTAGNTGTLGSLVTDNTDGALCILSNNHVMANYNTATLGDVITQPGPADGGTAADQIATLKRFVTMNPTGNTVDCAIAQVGKLGDVIDQIKNNVMPVATANHPAVGLLKAGGCNRTFMNPIGDVLKQLNVSFPGGAGANVGPDVDMNVEKVGRTTEYTSSTIAEIDVQIKTKDPNGNTFEFDHQFSTAWLSEAGDSGSVVFRGGNGGDEDKCGMCESTGTGEELLSTDLKLEAAIEKEFRERYLSHTRVGRYLIDVYFRNEARIVDRVRAARPGESDRAFARYLYDKHGDTLRPALLRPERAEVRVDDEHLQDARAALERALPHMHDDERHAAEALFKIVYQTRGHTPREILTMLDDEALLHEVQRILSTVRTLDVPRQGPSEAPPRQGT
jgi:hypothetical protein